MSLEPRRQLGEGKWAVHRSTPTLGVWLVAAMLRLVSTAGVLVRRHILAGASRKYHFRLLRVRITYRISSTIYRTLQRPASYRPEDFRRMGRSIPCPLLAISWLISPRP